MRKNIKRSKIVTSRRMRSADALAEKKYLIPPVILMENAGRRVAEEALKLRPEHVLVYCGGGNNGGDGFVAARHIFNNGVDVKVMLVKNSGKYSGSSLLNLKIIKKLKIPVIKWPPRSKAAGKGALIIDALLGTGIKGAVRENFRKAIEEINFSAGKVISVDIPSGIDADTGFDLGAAVNADITVTMAAVKKGLLKNQGKKCSGKIVVADISMPEELL